MNKTQLKELVESTLNELATNSRKNVNSPAAVNLIRGTIATESDNGQYIRQINGPALGICQMEPTTFLDILHNYLEYNPDLMRAVLQVSNVRALTPSTLLYNNKLAIIFCRLHYLRVPAALPVTIEGMSAYWKIYYNTHLGRGSVSQFIKSYKNYVL